MQSRSGPIRVVEDPQRSPAGPPATRGSAAPPWRRTGSRSKPTSIASAMPYAAIGTNTSSRRNALNTGAATRRGRERPAPGCISLVVGLAPVGAAQTQARAESTPPTKIQRRVPLAVAKEARRLHGSDRRRRRDSGVAMNVHDVSDGRLRVVDEQREQVPHRHPEEQERRQSRGDARAEEPQRDHGTASARRTSQPRGSGSTCVSRVNARSRMRRDPESEPATAAVEREDRRREGRGLESEPPAVRERERRVTTSGGRKSVASATAAAIDEPEAEQQEPEDGAGAPRRIPRARCRAASGRRRAGTARRRQRHREPALVERLVVGDPRGVPGVMRVPRAELGRQRALERPSPCLVVVGAADLEQARLVVERVRGPDHRIVERGPDRRAPDRGDRDRRAQEWPACALPDCLCAGMGPTTPGGLA